MLSLGNLKKPAFFVVVPAGRAENPTTHTNWEGVGVVPDVRVAPSRRRR